MADLILSGGKEINIDLSKITRKEFKELSNPAASDDGDLEILHRLTGLEIEELDALDMATFNKLVFAVWRKAANPLAEKN